MARPKKKFKKADTSIKVTRTQKTNNSFLERIQSDLENRQSLLSLVLGVLILVVVGVLIFNYFNKPSGELGSSQQTNTTNTPQDVAKEDLPGKYTVKEGDTLFEIAQNYYGDGYQYDKLAEVNKLTNPNFLATGQVLEIPKLDISDQNNQTATSSSTLNAKSNQADAGTGGATNQTIWGETITGDNYTIVEGDWLSKIAGRAYGDIYAFDKIAKENNISDPNNIEPGTVLKIPR